MCESATRCGCLNATSFVSVYLITAVVTWKQVNDDFHFDYEHWLIQLALTLPCTHSMSICCLLLVLYCYCVEWEWVHCSSRPFLKTVILYNLGNLGYHHCFDDAPSIFFCLSNSRLLRLLHQTKLIILLYVNSKWMQFTYIYSSFSYSITFSYSLCKLITKGKKCFWKKIALVLLTIS